MKHSLLRLSILALLLAITATCFAYDFEVDGIRYIFMREYQDGVVVCGRDRNGNTDVVIPETVNYQGNNYNVVAIGYQAFFNDNITSISMPNTIRDILYESFAYCKGLKYLSFPNKEINIAHHAISNCDDLISVRFPPNQRTFPYGCIYYCMNLKYVCFDCREITAWEFPCEFCDNLETVEFHAIEIPVLTKFYGYTKIILGEEVEKIADYMFSNGRNDVTVISLNPTPPLIGEYTFGFNKGERKLFVPNGSIDLYKAASGWRDFFYIDEIDATSINNILVDSENSGCIYNLNGTKVDGSSLGKGIYIKNGKKIIIK